MIPYINENQQSLLDGVDVEKPAPKKPRPISGRVMDVFVAANYLFVTGKAVTANSLRNALNALGLLTEDEGNQWLGDSLGDHGLGFPRQKVKGRTQYLLPPGARAITREMIEARYVVPPDWPWERWLREAPEPAPAPTAAAPVPTSTTQEPEPETEEGSRRWAPDPDEGKSFAELLAELPEEEPEPEPELADQAD